MKIDDHIYFAPDIKLKDVNLNNKEELLYAFMKRINRFYLSPIKILNKSRLAFSAGILLFSLIDALARYSSGNKRTGERIKEWLVNNFSISNEVAIRVYDEFRNGLIHESHIKNCGQFCYETTEPFIIEHNCLIVNPLRLQRAIDTIFQGYMDKLMNDGETYEIFLNNIKQDFESEVIFFKSIE